MKNRKSAILMNFWLEGNYMSSKKKNAPLPASSAGLLTFFNEETKGIKIRPEIVLIGSIVLIALSIVINAFFR
jgi:preprotein translocase subunit Sec61beta